MIRERKNPPGVSAAGVEEFERLYKEELHRVYNFFRYRFGESALAEDLTSATFEKAWRKRESFRRDLAAFSTWIFTIARRMAIDHYRNRRSREAVDRYASTNEADSIEVRIERQADFARLSTLLARLADREREVVSLKYGAGLTNRAIARLTGISESNVAVILHRVLRLLRGEWESST